MATDAVAATAAAVTKKRGRPSNAKREAPSFTPLPANPEAIKKLYQGQVKYKSKALSKK